MFSVCSIDANNSSSDASNILSTSGSTKTASTTVASNTSTSNTSAAQISIVTTSAGTTLTATLSTATGGTSANGQTNTINSTVPVPSPIHKHVKKSASASGLSLIIQSGTIDCGTSTSNRLMLIFNLQTIHSAPSAELRHHPPVILRVPIPAEIHLLAEKVSPRCRYRIMGICDFFFVVEFFLKICSRQNASNVESSDGN
jgi:hypothetical protein